MGYRLQRRLTALRRGATALPQGARRLIGHAIAGCALVAVALAMIILAPDQTSPDGWALWFALGLGCWLFAAVFVATTTYYAIVLRRAALLVIPLALVGGMALAYGASAWNDPPSIVTPALPAAPQVAPAPRR